MHRLLSDLDGQQFHEALADDFPRGNSGGCFAGQVTFQYYAILSDHKDQVGEGIQERLVPPLQNLF